MLVIVLHLLNSLKACCNFSENPNLNMTSIEATGTDGRLNNIYREYEPLQRHCGDHSGNHCERSWWNTNCSKGRRCDCDYRRRFREPTRALYCHEHCRHYDCCEGGNRLSSIASISNDLSCIPERRYGCVRCCRCY